MCNVFLFRTYSESKEYIIYCVLKYQIGSYVNKKFIHPTSIVEKTAIIGKGTLIWHFVHVRENARIGKNCVLGDYVYVGKGVIIGDMVKLENRATLFEGVEIEDKVFVGPDVTFTNDLFPRSQNTEWKILPTLVKKGSSIGAGSIILCGITIGNHSLIGAGSVVTENIPSHALVYGNPGRIRGFICRCTNKLIIKNVEKSWLLMKCQACKEEYKIPKEDYNKIEK